jgi:hypothetical protein
VLKCRVSGENGVVRLDNGARQLRCGVHAELELGLLAVIGRQTLKQKGTKARPGTTAKRVENEEALKTGAVVRLPTDLVHDGVDKLLADSVVTTSV